MCGSFTRLDKSGGESERDLSERDLEEREEIRRYRFAGERFAAERGESAISILKILCV